MYITFHTRKVIPQGTNRFGRPSDKVPGSMLLIKLKAESKLTTIVPMTLIRIPICKNTLPILFK
jgi:hypothetical protein